MNTSMKESDSLLFIERDRCSSFELFTASTKVVMVDAQPSSLFYVYDVVINHTWGDGTVPAARRTF
jgi:hypothetical protein